MPHRRNGHNRSRTQEADLAQSAGHVAESIKDLGNEARSLAEDQLAQARDTALGYWEDGRKQAADWEASLEDRIREQPVKSLAIAVGAGFLLGFLFRSR